MNCQVSKSISAYGDGETNDKQRISGNTALHHAMDHHLVIAQRRKPQQSSEKPHIHLGRVAELFIGEFVLYLSP